MPTPRATRKTTTEKGLGWAHQQAVAKLIRKHVDGTRCWWCGLPMFKDANKYRNWDRKQLAGDHSVPRVAGGQLADRLLHGDCNSQRGDGQWDHQRPILQGIHPSLWRRPNQTTVIDTSPTELAMDW